MAHFSSMCCSSTLNTQVIFYDCYGIHFYDRELNILQSRHIQYFILKANESGHDQPDNNSPNLKLNYLYGNERMNWMRNHVILEFILAHINSVVVEIW